MGGIIHMGLNGNDDPNLHPGPTAGPELGLGPGHKLGVGGPGAIHLEGEVITVLFPYAPSPHTVNPAAP